MSGPPGSHPPPSPRPSPGPRRRRARRLRPVSRRTGRPLTRRQLFWRRARRTIYALTAIAVIGPVVAFMIAYLTVDVPNPADLDTLQVATVFYDDGATALSRIVPPEGNRTNVTIDEIPVQLREAVLAAEDRSFYTNPGFSVRGIARAALSNVRGNDPQGGSTITQQYVKNALTGNDRTVTRKLKELVISSKMSRQVSKDDILAAYLNTIYFGRGAYGVDAAAKAYFNVDVGQITVPQAAVLASSIRSPSAYDPETHPQAAQDRWVFVLDGMVEQGWISAADRAPLSYPDVAPKNPPETGATADGPEKLIVTKVTDELAALGISESELNTEGLQITTTINQKNQAAAEAGVLDTLAGQPENLAPAVVSMDPKAGAVKAYYGNSQGSGFDFADSWGIQPGSSFKVFALATALKQGVPLSKTFDGSSPQTIAGIEVSNSDGEDCGRCDLAQALKLSLNTVFYQLTDDVGAPNVAETAHAAGVPTEYTDANGQVVPSLVEDASGVTADGIALGQYPVPVINMAGAYSTLANRGVQHDPYFVQKVTTADGRVLYDHGGPDAGTQALEAPVAQNVIAAMQPIAASSRDHGLAGGRESAAKTGTAQLGDTGTNANGWMIGCTPSLCTASVVTTKDQTSAETASGRLVYGSGLPSDIWKATMDGALEGTPEETFPDAPRLNGIAGGVPQTQADPPTKRTGSASTARSRAPRSTTTQPPATTSQDPAPRTTDEPTTQPSSQPPTPESAPESAQPSRSERPTRNTGPPPAPSVPPTGGGSRETPSPGPTQSPDPTGEGG